MMSASRPLRVLFRVAAGPRVGFGHLVRAVSLADALGVVPMLSVRGPESAHAAGRQLGAELVTGISPRRVLAAFRPDVLVIDDRVLNATAAWRRAARRQAVPIASVHDLGIGVGDADLVVDGSIGARPATTTKTLLGPSYAILNPRTVPTPRQGAGRRFRRVQRATFDVTIALGGGPRRLMAAAIARSLIARRPGLRIAVAGGFVTTAVGLCPPGVCWIRPWELGRSLASSRIALVAGGVTLYEGLALGVPVVAAAVVPSQRPTIARFRRASALLDAGLIAAGGVQGGGVQRAARQVVQLLDDPRMQRSQCTRGQAIVDGRGAQRVAREVVRLARAGGAWKARAR